MSTQADVLAGKPDSKHAVNAYVEALLAGPPAGSAIVPSASEPAQHPGTGDNAPAALPPSPAPLENPPGDHQQGSDMAALSAPPAPALPREAALPQPPDPPAVDSKAPAGQRWLRMAVGNDRYAVELLRVQEVVRWSPLIAIRGAAPSLLGVMNLRGRVVPVHDLGLWLHCAPVQVDERSRIVVLELQDELVGLLVTAVTDVVTLDGAQIEPPPCGLDDRIGMGIARTPGAPPTVLLDARMVFD